MSDSPLFSVQGKTFEPWCIKPGELPVTPLFDYGGSMSKVASSLDDVPGLQNFVNTAKPEDGWYTLLIHALGTDEMWGGNKKADAFPLAELVPHRKTAGWGYPTFETDAMGYVHHRNKPEFWTGRVLMAEFNGPMGRVELIAKFNIQRLYDEGTPYFAEALANGKLPAVSMGTRVPYDLCFPAGTLVRTSRGNLPIQDVAVGDKVLTHTGASRLVRELYRRRAEGTVKIHACGVPEVEPTENHPYLVLRKEQVRACQGSVNGSKRRHKPSDDGACSRCGKEIQWSLDWAAAEELRVGDYLVRKVDPSAAEDSVGPHKARLLGYYLGDGYIVGQKTGKKKLGPWRDMGVGVSTNSSEVEHRQRVIDTFRLSGASNEAREYGAGFATIGNVKVKKQAVEVRVYDQELALWIDSVAGRGSRTKNVSDEVFSWSKEEKLSVLGGYADTDGSFDEASGSLRIASVNRGLLLDAQRLAHSVGILASVSYGGESTGYVNTSGAQSDYWYLCFPAFEAQKLLGYSLKVQPRSVSFGSSQTFFWNNYWCAPVRKLEFVEGEREVFNFSVEGDESYIAEGLAVHNCSICGNKAPSIAQYCDHLKYQRLSVLPDGRRVRMFNIKPKFHDISLVSSPADPAARVLLKVAEEDKVSTIEKEVPASPAGGIRRLGKGEYEALVNTAYDPDVVLPKLLAAAQHSKHACYSSLTGLGILLRPFEFAAVELARVGNLTKAAEIYAARPEFPVYDLSTKQGFVWAPDESTAAAFIPDVAVRSVYFPQYNRRLGEEKTANAAVRGSVYISDSFHYGYSAYRKTAEQLLGDGTASKWALSRPSVLTAVLGSDIPMVLKLASLDEPRVVFGSVIRGAYL